MPFEDFMSALTQTERQTMDRLTSPNLIQAFLDETVYSADAFYRCPVRVLREQTAHCFDGALFAAVALRRLGFPPLILEMLPNDRDDDHLLAVFNRDGRWGTVAKSNFIGLRFREPVYRTLRELVMSYFEQFYNVEGEKTLRGYTLPLNLKSFDKSGWMTADEPLEAIAQRLDEIRRVELLTPDMINGLSLLDERSSRAGLAGANEAGLYRPDQKGGH
jgi:hypothetical protein